MKNKELISAGIFTSAGIIFVGLCFLFVSMYIYQKNKQYNNFFPKNEFVNTSFIGQANILGAAIDKEEKDYKLVIEPLNINTPIMLNIDGNDSDLYLNALKDGVAHLKGTNLPGQKGNIFIFGHSSYFFFDDGRYKDVFKNLDKLIRGDIVTIKSNLNNYDYKVYDIKIVSPSEIELIKSKDDSEIISLMTCYPTGTSAQRLIVLAKRI